MLYSPAVVVSVLLFLLCPYSAGASTWEPGSAAECLVDGCETDRLCAWNDDAEECVADAATCEASAACSYWGRCATGSDGSCVARSEKACRASRACREEAACHRVKDACVVRDDLACRKAPVCARDGRCTRSGGRCSLTSNADCRHTAPCVRRPCLFSHVVAGYEILRCDVAPAADESDELTCESAVSCQDYGGCEMLDRARLRCGTTVPSSSCASFAAVKPTRVVATSTHPPGAGYGFAATHLIDGDPRTSWQPRATSEGGVRERLTFTFGEPVELTCLRLTNGFQHRDERFGDLFAANNRVEALAIWRGEGAPPKRGTYPDDLRPDAPRPWQVVPVDYESRGELVVPLHGDRVTSLVIEIVAIAHGTRWNDLAISDIAFDRCAAK